MGDRTFSTLQTNCSFTSNNNISSFRPALLPLEIVSPLLHPRGVCSVSSSFWLVSDTCSNCSHTTEDTHKGCPCQNSLFTHRLDDAIAQACVTVGADPPQGGGAHSTRALISTRVLLKGVASAHLGPHCAPFYSFLPVQSIGVFGD